MFEFAARRGFLFYLAQKLHVAEINGFVSAEIKEMDNDGNGQRSNSKQKQGENKLHATIINKKQVGNW